MPGISWMLNRLKIAKEKCPTFIWKAEAQVWDSQTRMLDM